MIFIYKRYIYVYTYAYYISYPLETFTWLAGFYSDFCQVPGRMPKMVSFTEPRQASLIQVIFLEGLKDGTSETSGQVNQEQVKTIDVYIIYIYIYICVYFLFQFQHLMNLFLM